MKSAELRGLSEEAIREKLVAWNQEAFNLRFQHAVAQVENPARIRKVRRNIARAQTILGERSRQGKEG